MARKKPVIADPAQRVRLHSACSKKCVRGQGIYYQEKKENLGITLTPTARQRLQLIASNQKLSKSELIERIFRADMSALVALLKQ